MRVWNGFLKLIRDRLSVGRAIPAIVHFAAHRFWIAAGKCVLRLGDGADVNTTDGAWPPQNPLRQRQRGYDLIILYAAGGKYSGNTVRVPCDINLIVWLKIKPGGQALAEQNIFRSVVRPRALNLPPRVREPHSGHEICFSK